MFPLEMAKHALILPAVVAAATLWLARWAFRRGGLSGGDHAAAAIGIGAGYVAGHLAIARPAFPPMDVTDRVPWIAAAATLLGLLESARPGPSWTRWENRLLMTALVLGVVLGPLLEGAAGTRSGIARLAGLGLLALASWANLEALASRMPSAAIGPALLAVAGGSGVALMASGSGILGQLGIALAASLAAVGPIGRRSPGLALARGGVPVLVATTGALLIDGHVYAGLPASTGVVLALAPLAAWAGAVGPIRRAAPWKSALVGSIATLLPVGLAIGLAVAASPGFEG